MLSLRKRRQLYGTLTTTLRAGLPLAPLLEPQYPALALRTGESLTGALSRSKLLPADELAILVVGEESGDLEGCATLLAEYAEQQHQLYRHVWAAVRYPLLLLLLLPFICNVPSLFLGESSVVAFVVRSLMPLAGIVAAGAGVAYLMRLVGRRRVFTVASRLSLLGTVLRTLAQLQFLTLAAVMVRAGIGIRDSFQRLSACTDSEALSQEVAAWDALLDGGTPLSQSFSVLQSLGPASVQLLSTAATTGRLDASLETAAGYIRVELNGRLKTVQSLLPVMLLLAILLTTVL